MESALLLNPAVRKALIVKHTVAVRLFCAPVSRLTAAICRIAFYGVVHLYETSTCNINTVNLRMFNDCSKLVNPFLDKMNGLVFL